MASKQPSSSVIAPKPKLKLLLDSGTNKVVFAEVGKEFVDFLFSLFTLQLASVVRLLTKHQMVGCLGELYSSLESFSPGHWQPNIDRAQLLRPGPPPGFATMQKTLAMLRYDGLPATAGTPGIGYVKGGEALYMVTDDLVVTPLGTNGIAGAMSNVDDGRFLKMKTVELGMEEVRSI